MPATPPARRPRRAAPHRRSPAVHRRCDSRYPRSTTPSIARTPASRTSPPPIRDRLVEQRQRVAQATLRGRARAAAAPRASNAIASARGCAASRSAIAARGSGFRLNCRQRDSTVDRNLLRIGRREHELDVLGRLLERLQHRVERAPSTACALRRSGRPCSARPSARSARCRGSRACCRCRCSTPRRARAGRRSGRRRCRVHAAHSPHGVADTPRLAVEALRKDPGERRLADAARAGQQIGVVQAALGERVGQRRDDVLLADELGERARPPFAGEDLVAHRSGDAASRSSGVIAGCLRRPKVEAPAIRHQIGLRRGASRRQRGTYMDVRERWSRRATKYQVDLDDKEQEEASRSPGTCSESLWLLPSGPDQVHDRAMRGDPPLIGAQLPRTAHYNRSSLRRANLQRRR